MNLLGKPTVEFCEKAGMGLIKRPFYAVSNLSYLIVGIVILNRKTKLSKVFGFTSLFIGIASFVYDASYTYLSQLVDVFGMLLFVNLLLYLSAKRYFHVSTKKLLFFQAVAVFVGMFCVTYFKSYAGEFVFGVFIMAVIILEFLLWRINKAVNIRLWLIGLAVFLAGFIIWLPDASGWFCDPNNIFNGRSIFHILTAVTIYLLYQYHELQENKI